MLAALSRLKIYKVMSLDERGALLNVLCELDKSRGGFYADKAMKIPLTSEQIASLIGADIGWWDHFRDVLIKGKILKMHNGGYYCPLIANRVPGDDGTGDQELAKAILAHWNTKGIQVHSVTDSLVGRVTRLIRKYGYTQEQLIEAIDNYAVVLASSDHFWTKKWPIADFLSRGVDRFVSDANPLEQFRQYQPSGRGGRSIMAPREVEEYDFEGLGG